MAAKVRSAPKRPSAGGQAAKKSKRGRPSLFNPAIAGEICERIANGETLGQVCVDPLMPAKATVMRWLLQPQHKEFRDQYARARDLQADSLAESVIAIADDGSADVVPDGKGGRTIDWENVQRSRLRCDARKWFASKVAPKKYGERLAQELSGPDGGPIVTGQAHAIPLPPAEVSAAVRELVARAEKELGLEGADRLALKDRVKRILQSGQLLPPELYAALRGRGSSGEDGGR